MLFLVTPLLLPLSLSGCPFAAHLWLLISGLGNPMIGTVSSCVVIEPGVRVGKPFSRAAPRQCGGLLLLLLLLLLPGRALGQRLCQALGLLSRGGTVSALLPVGHSRVFCVNMLGTRASYQTEGLLCL